MLVYIHGKKWGPTEEAKLVAPMAASAEAV